MCLCGDGIGLKVNRVRIDGTTCNVCTRSASYDRQTGHHLHKTETKGHESGALLRYFTALLGSLLLTRKMASLECMTNSKLSVDLYRVKKPCFLKCI